MVAGSTWGRAGRRFRRMIFFFFCVPSASVVVVIEVSVGCVVRAFSSLGVGSAPEGGGLGIMVWVVSATSVSAMVAVLKGLFLWIEKLECCCLKAKSVDEVDGAIALSQQILALENLISLLAVEQHRRYTTVVSVVYFSLLEGTRALEILILLPTPLHLSRL